MAAERALITGASAGLGREFARQLAARGTDLILVARRVELMQDLAAKLESEHGIDAVVIQADLSDAAAPGELYRETEERGLHVDWLINNAGSSNPDLIGNPDWPASRDYLNLMMSSVVALCHFFVPPMRKRGFGRVLNVASVAGLVPTPGDYSYGPTKAYLVAFSKALSASFGDDGINITALCPGFTHTDFHQSERLTRMKRSLPKFLWYDAEVVVRDGLQALEEGRDVCVSGRLYRFLVPLLRSPLGRLAFYVLGLRRKAAKPRR